LGAGFFLAGLACFAGCDGFPFLEFAGAGFPFVFAGAVFCGTDFGRGLTGAFAVFFTGVFTGLLA
jgi:hypothetical protein